MDANAQNSRPTPVLDPPQLMQRVCVRPPYFALSQLQCPEPGTVSAIVVPEQPLGAEAGPIPAAEAGRHLAIIGSLAVASRHADDQQRYYLARAARFERVCNALAGGAGRLIAEAHAGAAFDGARSATARTLLRTPDGVVTHLLRVEYTVLGARVFERMFGDLRKPAPAAQSNPHADPVLLEIRELDGAHGRAATRFSPAQCAGHFENCAAVPVARLMQGLVMLAGRLLQHRAAEPALRFAVLRADVRAQRLAFAGDELLLRADHVGERGRESAIRARATLADGTAVGELDVWLAREPD